MKIFIFSNIVPTITRHHVGHQKHSKTRLKCSKTARESTKLPPGPTKKIENHEKIQSYQNKFEKIKILS